MNIFDNIKYVIKNFIELDEDYKIILSNQDKIFEKLEQLEQLEKVKVESQQLNLSDYLTVKNLIYLLIFLGFIGGGIWLYNTDFFNNSTLESIKSLGELSKNLNKIDQNGFFSDLKKLNENSIDLSNQQIKLLIEIKNLLLLLKKEIDENKSIELNRRFTQDDSIQGFLTNL